MTYTDHTTEEIEILLLDSVKAFRAYGKMPLKKRAEFMRAIAREIEALGDILLQTAAEETNLTEPRLRNERGRTIFQLISYAEACERGDWLEIKIDTGLPERNPPRQDIRKMLVPIGPVAVFGASNFPFAYSTAGGDTACAFAAGCSVIVKAHPAHAQTSELVASAVLKAAKDTNMPDGIFAHVYGAGTEVGEALVKHPLVKAVGFTGSLAGGRQLFDWASQRKEPIPVFAEMSSINPVFLLPEKLKQSADEIARLYASSITLGVGQFCTNPGLLLGIESEGLDTFVAALGEEIRQTSPGNMLHMGIFKNYVERRANALSQEEVTTVAVAEGDLQLNQGAPTIATVSGEAFLNNPVLHMEVFGPYSLVVRCKDLTEMTQIANHIEGQLTATLMATEADISYHEELVDAIRSICGRFILNSVPTGVEVCQSMHHGGPYPATTDSRFTSVGADGIKRFARPVAYQNWSNDQLPQELKNENTLGIWRTVNDKLSKDPIK
ncbi:MAG: aldehyde dehydrogenase (NADP(+)) [Chitinophagaceae bacterium]|nr:aldehyde dehydrogenase (NADP(+)) [Chitinophagaceae bacterium]